MRDASEAEPSDQLRTELEPLPPLTSAVACWYALAFLTGPSPEFDPPPPPPPPPALRFVPLPPPRPALPARLEDPETSGRPRMRG